MTVSGLWHHLAKLAVKRHIGTNGVFAEVGGVAVAHAVFMGFKENGDRGLLYKPFMEDLHSDLKSQ